MKTIAALFLLCSLAGCAGLPPRTYSLGYVSPEGQALSGSVSFGDTRLVPPRDTLFSNDGKAIKPLHK